MKDRTSLLILLRHGESEWNRRNLFTGRVDVPLSRQGIDEAFEAGRKFSAIPLDVIFTSTLIRSKLTAMIAMSVHAGGRVPICLPSGEEASPFAEAIPVIASEALDERMYGDLQGLNKDEAAKRFGPEQIRLWRRSYAVAPPGGESLKMTKERALPYFRSRIVPRLERGENVFVSAHGNSLRAIVMFLENLSEEEILCLEIPTGVPRCYRLRQERGGGVWQPEELDLVRRQCGER
ncbi:MAG: histidine phosphatase family protein [Simkaniaceae bacterium]|nr:histidine phosphatase family protein [Simkaniaceae bacterium]